MFQVNLEMWGEIGGFIWSWER